MGDISNAQIVLFAIQFIISIFLCKLTMILKKPKKVRLLCGISIFILLGFALVPTFYWSNKYGKKREAEFYYIANNLNNNSVDRFIKYINEWGCVNKPDAWGQLKGVFRIVNESSNISYNKKKELRDCLMLNGLKLYNNEMNIIDNYK